jgi:hypothetical protein
MNPANDNRHESSNAPRGAGGLTLLHAHDPISKIERPKMKTKITTIGRIVGFAIAVALSAVAATAANAQDKGATKLLQLSAPKATPAAIVSDYKPMPCANCKDSFVTVPDTEIKGAGARALVTGGTPTRIVAKHLCGSCANEWVVKGHGKAKVSVPLHKCASCG